MPYWDNSPRQRCGCGGVVEDPMVSPLCFGCWCHEQDMKDQQYPEPTLEEMCSHVPDIQIDEAGTMSCYCGKVEKGPTMTSGKWRSEVEASTDDLIRKARDRGGWLAREYSLETEDAEDRAVDAEAESRTAHLHLVTRGRRLECGGPAGPLWEYDNACHDEDGCGWKEPTDV